MIPTLSYGLKLFFLTSIVLLYGEAQWPRTKAKSCESQISKLTRFTFANTEPLCRKKLKHRSEWSGGQKHTGHITVFEFYANVESYRAHVASPHFKKYKSMTKEMVKSLEEIETNPIAFRAKPKK